MLGRGLMGGRRGRGEVGWSIEGAGWVDKLMGSMRFSRRGGRGYPRHYDIGTNESMRLLNPIESRN